MSQPPPSAPATTILPFPAPATPAATPARTPSSTEKIWGKAVLSHGFTGVPSILIQAQRRLELRPTMMNIVLQLLDYLRDPARMPFPTKRDLATRIGVTEKTIQINIRLLEQKGFLKRIQRKAAAGDWNSNIYDMAGLVAKIQSLEPEFAADKKKRKAAREALEKPAWLASKTL